ncbi:MAG TPA: phosphopyruvate hydratase [Patescibacteria group bacterium]|nr:phosphopyruvate hydratase [Patescibacteria group bacterium]
MSKIKSIHARQILDSRANPTVETTVILTDGITARSAVPSGAVANTYEAIFLRDSDQTKYAGMGVLNAVKNVNEVIAPKIEGMEVLDQQKIDKAMIEMDGTPNKAKLGANATLSVSQAVVKAAAQASMLPTPLYIRQFVSGNFGKNIPIPMFNLIEGGKHGGQTINLQEVLLIPASSKSFSESLEMSALIYHALKKNIYERSQTTLNADEGGFSPALATNVEAFNLLKDSIERAGFTFSLDAFMGIDASANNFVDGKLYRLKDRAVPYNSDDLVEFYRNIISEYGLIYVEDPFSEDDWEGWKKMYQALGDKTIIAGDDLTTTNPYRLQLALDNKVINAMLIKPSQIGTVTEAIAVAEVARYTGLKIVVSHRSGETLDPFSADFAVGIGADYTKFGAPARERVSKYNKLLEIEEELAKI